MLRLRFLPMLALCGVLRMGAAAGDVSAAGASSASGMAWRLPPLDGELSGAFRPLTHEGAPTLQWKMTIATSLPGVRDLVVTAEALQTSLRAELRLDAAGHGTWRLLEAHAEIGAWIAALLPLAGPDFGEVTARGRLNLDGEGRIDAAGVSGRARVVLRDGNVNVPAHKLVLEGVSLDFMMADIRARRSPPAQSLAWRGGTYEEIPLGPGRVVFSVDGETVQVDEASMGVFGGELILSAFSFSLKRGEVSVIARVAGIDVSQIIPLLPPVLAAARGRVDGSLMLHRTPAGVQIGNGRLALRAGETADLRLAPTPGLLSNSLPEAVLKYYPGLGKIETGEVPIRADHLEVAFTPGGDSQGRTASIRIAGGPVDPKLRAPVDLNINVRGPLESLIKFGTDSRLRFGGKP